MSPQQKRSSQYDWFKGTPSDGHKKTPKEQAKVVWKFTKILLYLCLFVFSMTGCIQTLVIKTETTVGKGVEFYSSNSEVAPHVSKITVNHVPTTTSSEEIYTADVSQSNYWLNKDVKGEGNLANVHKAISGQSTKGKLNLADAFKGSNEGLIIQGSSDSNTGVSTDANGNLLVLSSLADKSAFTNYEDSDKKFLNGIIIYDDSTGEYKTSVLGKTSQVSLASYAGEYTFKLAKIFDGALASDGKTLVHLEGVDFGDFQECLGVANALVADPKNGWNAVTQKFYNDKIDEIKNDYEEGFSKMDSNINQTRMAYSLAALKKMLPSSTLAWLKSSLTLPLGYSNTNEVMKDEDSNKSEVLEYQRQVNARTNYFKNIVGAVGLVQNSFNLEDGFHFEAGNYPFNPGSTDWRPLVTWGDSWGEGPFYGIFVYPVAYISANMINSMPLMSGWETLISIFVIVFAIRILSFLLSFKAIMQQTKMQELSSKKAIIDAKYAAYKGNKQMENRQRQEISEMYKKEGVSMFGSISSIFLTMPFFLAIWRTIGGLPHIKSAVWLGINFSATSYKELFSGEFQYLPLMLLAAGFAAFQQILPRILTKRRDKNRINVHQKAAMKKNNKTQNIMIVVFVIMSVVFSAGLQVYWIAGGLWMTIQSFITHHLFINQSKKNKHKKIQV